MIVFENPMALWLLLIIFPIIGIGWWGWKIKKRIFKVFRVERKSGKVSQVKKYITIGAMIALVIIALARPYVSLNGREALKETKTGQILLLVDVSESMAATPTLDSPDRLERAKAICYEIIEALTGAEISLYAFTNTAFSHVSFVSEEDFAYLLRSIKEVLDIHSVPGYGTNLAGAIESVLDKFSNETSSKVIVLLSDGEYYSATRGISEIQRKALELVLQKAVEKNIKVIPVGIGEVEGARIPLYDQEGNFVGYAMFRKSYYLDRENGLPGRGSPSGLDYKEEIYISYLEEELLREIASKSSSEYFFEKDVSGLINYIGQCLTPRPVDLKEQGYQDIGYFLLLPIIALWIVFSRYYLR